MGLICQHDFERILAPDELYPLIHPASIHSFWHLKQQHELEAEAKTVALEHARNNATVGTFFTHYPLDELPITPTATIESALVPMNEYLAAGEILREMSPDAVIIQEPISRPQFVRAQAKKKRKRELADVIQGQGSVEDIVVPHAKSNRMNTGAELAEQAAKRIKAAAAANLKENSQGKISRGCGRCSKPGHNIRTCPEVKVSQASALMVEVSQHSQASLGGFPSQHFVGISPFAARAHGNIPQQYYPGSQPGPSSAPIAPSSQLGRYYQ